MDIYRLKSGLYHCINNQDNNCKYVLVRAKGCYSTLVPVEDCVEMVNQWNTQQLYTKAVPIPCFSKKENKNK